MRQFTRSKALTLRWAPKCGVPKPLQWASLQNGRALPKFRGWIRCESVCAAARSRRYGGDRGDHIDPRQCGAL